MEPSIIDTLYQNLNFRAERQKVISGNIANINTPNYKTKDLSFEDELKKSSAKNDMALKVTHHKHISFQSQSSPVSKLKVYEVKGLQEQNDGNNVNLDQQMSEMAKNSIMFSAVKSAIKKGTGLTDVITASSKN